MNQRARYQSFTAHPLTPCSAPPALLSPKNIQDWDPSFCIPTSLSSYLTNLPLSASFSHFLWLRPSFLVLTSALPFLANPRTCTTRLQVRRKQKSGVFSRTPPPRRVSPVSVYGYADVCVCFSVCVLRHAFGCTSGYELLKVLFYALIVSM